MCVGGGAGTYQTHTSGPVINYMEGGGGELQNKKNIRSKSVCILPCYYGKILIYKVDSSLSGHWCLPDMGLWTSTGSF